MPSIGWHHFRHAAATATDGGLSMAPVPRSWVRGVPEGWILEMARFDLSGGDQVCFVWGILWEDGFNSLGNTEQSWRTARSTLTFRTLLSM